MSINVATITVDASQAEEALDALLAKIELVKARAAELRKLNLDADEEVSRVLEGIEAMTAKVERG